MSKVSGFPVSFPDLNAISMLDATSIEMDAKRFEFGNAPEGDRRSEELRLLVSMLDLTTLEGTDTPDRVRSMCKTATHPDLGDFSVPHVAAVCVYPTLVGVAVKALQGSPVRVASVAGAFPSGQARISQKTDEIKYAVDEGANEIDIVISRGKFLNGEYREVFDEICQCREACGKAHLKVILETGELGSYDNIRVASEIAMAAGAHFIKTSTGKITPAATFSATLVMLQSIRDFHARTGRRVGIKPAGGIRTTEQAFRYLGMVGQVLGADWLTPEWFRFGASSLLDDLVQSCRDCEI
jgi:deoxyribose-phosphate aldolase